MGVSGRPNSEGSPGGSTLQTHSLPRQVRMGSSVGFRLAFLLLLVFALQTQALYLGSDGSPVHGVAKRRPEMGAQGFTGDSFNGGFGDFYTMKRSGGRSSIDAKLDYIIQQLAAEKA